MRSAEVVLQTRKFNAYLDGYSYRIGRGTNARCRLCPAGAISFWPRTRGGRNCHLCGPRLDADDGLLRDRPSAPPPPPRPVPRRDRWTALFAETGLDRLATRIVDLAPADGMAWQESFVLQSRFDVANARREIRHLYWNSLVLT